MKGVHLGELGALVKLFFTLFVCGGLLAFGDSKLPALIALIVCMLVLFR